MIVIASHDRYDLINNLLEQLTSINLNSHDILVVDTNSTDLDFLKKFNNLPIKYPNIKFDRLNYDCRDSGAYIYAYKNYKRESYIFLQDSIKIINNNIILEFDNFLKENDVISPYTFNYFYDTDYQKEWVIEGINCTEPEWAIFGPLFAVNKSALDKIPDNWLKYPTSKIESCGMERRWSLIFHALNIPILYPYGYFHPNEKQINIQKILTYKEREKNKEKK